MDFRNREQLPGMVAVGQRLAAQWKRAGAIKERSAMEPKPKTNAGVPNFIGTVKDGGSDREQRHDAR